MNQKLMMVFGTFLIIVLPSMSDEASPTGKTKPNQVVTTPAPFPNYWDANSWEQGSSESFWSAKPKTESRQITPKREISKTIEKSKVWQRKAEKK